MDHSSLLMNTGVILSPTQLQQFEVYADLLVEWNQKFNLTSITDRDDIFVKHFQDCLMLLSHYGLNGTVADVGAGAGFPGLVLAIARSDLQLTLIEPTGKRCTFLREVASQLNLTNVEVVNARSEDYARTGRKFDFVTARAVAQLNILLELCLPLVRTDGHFIAMKGPKAPEEIQASKRALNILKGEIASTKMIELPEGQQRILIDIHKYAETPDGYPRNYSQIKKKPL